MSSSSKGKDRERECKKWFSDEGALVDFKSRSRFRSDDLFGIFDFVAVLDGDFIWVQVKSDKSDFYKARKEIEDFISDFDLDMRAEVWLWIAREPWLVSRFLNGHWLDARVDRF